MTTNTTTSKLMTSKLMTSVMLTSVMLASIILTAKMTSTKITPTYTDPAEAKSVVVIKIIEVVVASDVRISSSNNRVATAVWAWDTNAATVVVIIITTETSDTDGGTYGATTDYSTTDSTDDTAAKSSTTESTWNIKIGLWNNDVAWRLSKKKRKKKTFFITQTSRYVEKSHIPKWANPTLYVDFSCFQVVRHFTILITF